MSMRPHANVVQLFGVCLRPCRLALVFEYMEGGNLRQVLDQPAIRLNLSDGLRIALEIAAGMSHLHAEGICHRDLAARNGNSH